ncbi:hypothetical protein HDZ31DRAFT_32388 [Schizophyllum fasciatum]
MSHPSRPATPESVLANSLYRATTNIDDLTKALTDFSRVPSPEPPLASCCCGREDCEHAKAWAALKARLESRLILSAEVGQALLQRHEAYVREEASGLPCTAPAQCVGCKHIHRCHESHRGPRGRDNDAELRRFRLDRDIEDGTGSALINAEVTEATNKSLLEEVDDARATISRLTGYQARSLGWEAKVAAAQRERDDMQQERDGESQRARLSESRFAALKEKTKKLQAELRRLQEELEEKRMHRLETSESLIQDARSRIHSFQQTSQTRSTQSREAEHEEMTKVLESLVSDNEILKRDNAELQRLLTESREDLHTLQEELEEQKAAHPSRAPTPIRHQHTGSVPTSNFRDFISLHKSRRSESADRRSRRSFEPLTPETSRFPLSPREPSTPLSPTTQIRVPANLTLEVDEDDIDEDDDEQQRRHKPLLLLSRSRGVQTDAWPTYLAPSGMTSPSPHDPRSESSSFSESTASALGVLFDRLSTLYNRMTQADALTLTNRLKRQHLRGADVGHLSRTTVNAIVNDASNLRAQFRGLLEDEKAVVTCTRKDLRVLFKLVRDLFSELGELRVALNDVILDPGCAPRLSTLALDPAKAERERQASAGSNSGASGWIAPISKLFGAPAQSTGPPERVVSPLARSGSQRAPRLVPKLSPATATASTTVNVEFSGSGVGRSIASSYAPSPVVATHAPAPTPSGALSRPAGASRPSHLHIFAGAPRPAVLTPDSWVVVPKGGSLREPGTPAFRRPALPGLGEPPQQQRLSRNVDAVIDVETPDRAREEGTRAGGSDGAEAEAADVLGPLAARRLRRRGLSDSSIHSTFLSQAPEPEAARAAEEGAPPETPTESAAGSVGSGVLRALSRRVQNFRSATLSAAPPALGARSVSTSSAATASSGQSAGGGGFSDLLPSLSAWSATVEGPDGILTGHRERL